MFVAVRNLSILLLLVGLLGLKVAAQNDTFTLEEISAKMDAFLETVENGTLGTRSTDSLPSRCSLACFFLAHALPGKVSFPDTTAYQFQESRYWSIQQATAAPVCRLAPTSALDVSVGLLSLRVANCKFAVKSGGHGPFYGASNINGGVTIDLLNLNQISASADKTQTSIGTGNRWIDVYNYLQPKGLTVIGGRVADIGVGGLTLGGGISFFSGRYGWACDNVNSYQVVFADGTIREVSYTSYPDLYFALRGGGNNFGIVTRLDLATFTQGDLWAGTELFGYNTNTAAAIDNAFYNLNINAPSDPYAAVILAYAYVQSIDTFVISSALQYGKPVENPPIFQNFTAVPGAISSTLRITNLTSLTVEFNNTNPGGFRQTYWALMAKNSASLMADITKIYMEEVTTIKGIAGVLPSLVYQPITTAMMSHFSKNGGNALGFSDKDGPLNLIQVDISWSLASDDTAVYAAASNIINRANATAYAQGLGFPFIYQNYAELGQQVFPSYGAKNLAKLRATSMKYDPTGVWQKLQPGYFKVF